MKALKSSLAKEILADREAADQLRQFLATKSQPASTDAPARVIELKQANGHTVRIKPVVVGKAA